LADVFTVDLSTRLDAEEDDTVAKARGPETVQAAAD